MSSVNECVAPRKKKQIRMKRGKVCGGLAEVAIALIPVLSDLKDHALVLAAENGLYDAVKTLISHYEDEFSQSSLIMAFRHLVSDETTPAKILVLLNDLISDDQAVSDAVVELPRQSMISACVRGWTDVVKDALAKGYDVRQIAEYLFHPQAANQSSCGDEKKSEDYDDDGDAFLLPHSSVFEILVAHPDFPIPPSFVEWLMKRNLHSHLKALLKSNRVHGLPGINRLALSAFCGDVDLFVNELAKRTYVGKAEMRLLVYVAAKAGHFDIIKDLTSRGAIDDDLGTQLNYMYTAINSHQGGAFKVLWESFLTNHAFKFQPSTVAEIGIPNSRKIAMIHNLALDNLFDGAWVLKSHLINRPNDPFHLETIRKLLIASKTAETFKIVISWYQQYIERADQGSTEYCSLGDHDASRIAQMHSLILNFCAKNYSSEFSELFHESLDYCINKRQFNGRWNGNDFIEIFKSPYLSHDYLNLLKYLSDSGTLFEFRDVLLTIAFESINLELMEATLLQTKTSGGYIDSQDISNAAEFVTFEMFYVLCQYPMRSGRKFSSCILKLLQRATVRSNPQITAFMVQHCSNHEIMLCFDCILDSLCTSHVVDALLSHPGFSSLRLEAYNLWTLFLSDIPLSALEYLLFDDRFVVSDRMIIEDLHAHLHFRVDENVEKKLPLIFSFVLLRLNHGCSGTALRCFYNWFSRLLVQLMGGLGGSITLQHCVDTAFSTFKEHVLRVESQLFRRLYMPGRGVFYKKSLLRFEELYSLRNRSSKRL